MQKEFDLPITRFNRLFSHLTYFLFLKKVNRNIFGLVFDLYNLELNNLYKMFSITYSTFNLKGDNLQFYRDVASTTDAVLSHASFTLADYIDNYQQFILNNSIEQIRAKNEYLLELIILGVLWRNKGAYVQKSTRLATSSLHSLYAIRKANKQLKPSIDKIRGWLISSTLFGSSKSKLIFGVKSFKRLLSWLNATGEYAEEVKRLKGWLEFTKTMSENELLIFMAKVYAFAAFFESRSAKSLGIYTSDVSRFVEKAKKNYKGREDFALANRSEVEYHMNMVGAEILNRELRSNFISKKNKIVLLPTCMRGDWGGMCKATDNGLEKKCIGCNAKCNVGNVHKSMQPYGVDVCLIPHSSDFSKFLQRWKGNDDVALVGVACVPNLLMGGYEMIDLNIASQCIYLDFCGCKKHWDRKGIATTINIQQLKNLIDVSSKSNTLGVEQNRIKVA